MQELVIATHNNDKKIEMQYALKDLEVKILSLDSFPEIGEIEESGSTLLENSFIKAKEVYRKTGIPTLADDTGLEVEFLNGAPGVYSARTQLLLFGAPVAQVTIGELHSLQRRAVPVYSHHAFSRSTSLST